MKNTLIELLAAGAVVVVFFAVLVGVATTTHPLATPTPGINPSATAAPSTVALSAGDFKTFKTWDEAAAFLSTATSGNNDYGGGMMRETAMPLAAAAPSAEKSTDVSTGSSGSSHSTTNVQVAGVDEDDTLKNDGRYVYTVTNGQITIVDAYPASQAHIVAILNDSNSTYQSIFIAGNKLVAFGTENYDWTPVMKPLVQDQTNGSASQDDQGIVVFNPTTGEENIYNGTDAPDNQTGSASSEPAAAAPASVSSKIAAMPICLGCRPYPYYGSSGFMRIFDVSDRATPVLLKTVEFDGNLQAARLIDKRVYAVFTEYAGSDYPRPRYAVDGRLADVQPSDVRYIDYPFDSYQFTTVLGQDVNDVNQPESRAVILSGGSGTVYVSADNAYVTYTQYQTYTPSWEPYRDVLQDHVTAEFQAKLAAIDASDASEWRKDRLKVNVAEAFMQSLDQNQAQGYYEQISKRQEAMRQNQAVFSELTVIHQFGLGMGPNLDQIQYLGEGSVPGHLLNQFSMDESGGYLRLATTVSQQWQTWPMMRVLAQEGNAAQPTPIPSKNNVYVLQTLETGNLNIVGRLEDLAPGESIYSTRFIDNRAYLVTFRQLDPLFVIGLDDPAHPTLLGKLKIPGYSNYLHPYDATHLIGFGKDAIPLKDNDELAFPLGLKLSLFDVSDVANPKEVATLGIGDAGSDSYALNDHKAFLFDKDKGIIVIPVRLAVIPPEKKTGDLVHVYGDVKFQGAYVIRVDPTCAAPMAACNVFSVQGTVAHVDNETLAKMGDYYYGDGTDVTRSAWIDGTLYTMSDKYLKANDLATLAPQASVSLPASRYAPYPQYWAEGGVAMPATAAPGTVGIK